jgi:hypothetical protein
MTLGSGTACCIGGGSLIRRTIIKRFLLYWRINSNLSALTNQDKRIENAEGLQTLN